MKVTKNLKKTKITKKDEDVEFKSDRPSTINNSKKKKIIVGPIKEAPAFP